MAKKDKKVEENRKPESFNIDTLLNAYKVEANKQNKPEAESMESERELSSHNSPKIENKWKTIPTIKERSTVPYDKNIDVKYDLPLKEKKVKSLTIKSKHQEAKDDKSSKILLPVLKVSNDKSYLRSSQHESQILSGGTKKWGNVNLSTKKIISTKRLRKPLEPVFWDEVEKTEEDEEDSTFTGLK